MRFDWRLGSGLVWSDWRGSLGDARELEVYGGCVFS